VFNLSCTTLVVQCYSWARRSAKGFLFVYICVVQRTYLFTEKNLIGFFFFLGCGNLLLSRLPLLRLLLSAPAGRKKFVCGIIVVIIIVRCRPFPAGF
jgi:hypothetical protein